MFDRVRDVVTRRRGEGQGKRRRQLDTWWRAGAGGEVDTWWRAGAGGEVDTWWRAAVRWTRGGGRGWGGHVIKGGGEVDTWWRASSEVDTW